MMFYLLQMYTFFNVCFNFGCLNPAAGNDLTHVFVFEYYLKIG